MRVVFRADASLDMGSGHVMRCLTLACSLRAKGHECLFICREHVGNLHALIQSKGFVLHSLPLGKEQDKELPHSPWLGASQAEDALACQKLIAACQPDWLVVDHYALDRQWEVVATPAGCRLLVIDDLADRPHACDLLLDQNLGRRAEDYRGLLPEHCTLLVGPSHALLRPEFAALRDVSLARRQRADLHNVLIAMGGVDQHNYTSTILDALKYCQFPSNICFTVVLGATAPHQKAVKAAASECPWPVEVLSGVNDMAEHMVRADLAIGAGGGTSWERCCLGVPTLLIVLADNQRTASEALVATGAVMLIDLAQPLIAQLQGAVIHLSVPSNLRLLAEAASQVADGSGVEQLQQMMESRL